MTRVAKRDVLLRGTLDMLILRTLQWGPTHGHDIAKHIQRRTDDVLQVAAWLALSRPPSASPERLDLFQLGDAQNAQPRILVYRLTAAGRRQLTAEEQQWRRLSKAIASVMWPQTEE